jgi:Xaa-Pro aminopeptidase
MASFGTVGMDWQQRINWQRMREYRLSRARDAMRRHGLGAILCMYDENVRYITSTLTPGWCRLKPGLRYAVLVEGREPILFEQGDIGIHVEKHSPWLPKENIRHSFSWIKGAAGPASEMQVAKFTKALLEALEEAGVSDQPLGVDFIDINMIRGFERAGITWTDGMTPMMQARSVKNVDEQEAMRIVGAIGDALHYEFSKFLKPGLTENQVTAFGMKYLYDFPGMEDVEDIIVSSGPNAWPNWRNFSDRIIRPGEIVIIDLAALTWNGFKSCYYRTYCVGGKPTDEHKRYYDTALKWLYDSIEAVRPGATTGDIASRWPSAQDTWGYADEDQAAANLWGHGLGLAQYDMPVISRIWSLDFPQEIQTGMVFALETQHGKVREFGVRIEEMMIVQDDGPELITTFPVNEITMAG